MMASLDVCNHIGAGVMRGRSGLMFRNGNILEGELRLMTK